MKYIRISREYCFCVYEPIDMRKLERYFRVGRVAFVLNKQDQVIGILSLNDYRKGLEAGECRINKSFKKIRYKQGGGYIEEAESFFNDTNYYSIPVLNEKEELIECFMRMNPAHKTEITADKWLDTKNRHLAELVKRKRYRKIKVCMMNSLSEKIYQYFKYYHAYYDMVEKVLWYDILETEKDDLLITNDKMNIHPDISTYSFHSMQIELEYNQLLHNCKKGNLRFYIVSVPTAENVWNVTNEERKRIHQGKIWKTYLEDKEENSEVLEEVLDIEGDKDKFIESCLNLPPVIVKNGLCYEREHTSEYVNVINGNRLTVGGQENLKSHIYLAGNSYVFGLLVDDGHTVASHLQRIVCGMPDYSDYKVVNEGIRGTPFYESLRRLNHDALRDEDIIVLFVVLKNFFYELEEDAAKNILYGIKIYHLEDVFNTLNRKKIKSYFLESPVHPNSFGYEKAAEYLMRIFKEKYIDLWKNDIQSDYEQVYEKQELFDGKYEELKRYLGELRRHRMKGSGIKGAVVMNCNPLTYGHQHLIKYAVEKVEHLYIFVVQEDRSVFSFEERFAMVQACAAEYSNITVLPSGQFIISAFTFPEYFTKQMENPETIIDTSNDVIIFGKYVAPVLDITVRFAGEEPEDFITAKYNAAMKELLPEYGVSFVEIPRYSKKGLGVISGTKVRDALQKNLSREVKKLVPETTYQILKEYNRLK